MKRKKWLRFKVIKNSLHLDYVRIFLIWEDFQPYPDKVNEESLNKLEKVLDIASSLDLKIMPTFFTGHMSGVNWMPEWALSDEEWPAEELKKIHKQISNGQVTSKKLRDIYTDEFMLTAQNYQIKKIVERFHNHPAIYGWDISNGCTHFHKPKELKDERNWNLRLYNEIKKYDKIHLITLGPATFLGDISNFEKDILIESNNILSVHGYRLLFLCR